MCPRKAFIDFFIFYDGSELFFGIYGALIAFQKGDIPDAESHATHMVEVAESMNEFLRVREHIEREKGCVY
jgi:hypothetical protein